MKKIALMTIEFYQKIFSVFLLHLGLKGSCRFTPTCSEYAKISIKEHGITKGGKMAIVRLLKCQPFYKQAVSV